MREEEERVREEEKVKRTQRCIKLFPHRRRVDKETLSQPERALHGDGGREDGGREETQAEDELGQFLHRVLRLRQWHILQVVI